MTGAPPSVCVRTRTLLSEQLDVVVSELEERAIARHVSECAACSAFEAQSRWLTRELRGAPLQGLSKPVFASPIRSRRFSNRVAGNVASAAALLVVVVGGYAVGTAGSVDQAQDLGITPSPTAESALGDPLRALRVEALRAGVLPILPATDPPPNVKPPRPATDW